MADLSGYFVIGYDSSNIAKICKYTNKNNDENLCNIIKLIVKLLSY